MLCRCWATLLVGIDRSFCANQIVGLYNSSGRSSLRLRSLWIYFELRDCGLPWLLITKNERTVFTTQHNRYWNSLWPRDSAISRRQLQMVRYGSFASPCVSYGRCWLWIPDLQNWYFPFFITKYQVHKQNGISSLSEKFSFLVQNILLEKCNAVQPRFHCCVVLWFCCQTGASCDWCFLSPVCCTRLDSTFSYRKQAQSSSSHNCSMCKVSTSCSNTYFYSCRNIIIFTPLFCSHIHLKLANLLQRWQRGDSRSGKKERQISLKCSPASTSPSCCWTAQRLLHACPKHWQSSSRFDQLLQPSCH